MRLSEFLVGMGDLMENALYTASYSCKYGLFLYDMLGYICGENLKHDLSDYEDTQNDTLWEDMQNGRCGFCWVNTDKGPYGFRIREEYAYLPDYEDFVSDMAYKLFDSRDETALEKIRERIRSLDLQSEKESLDLEAPLMDDELVETVLQIYPDFFEFSGTNEKDIGILIHTFFDMLSLCGEDMGCGEWKLLNLESPAVNAWLQFLYGDKVSDQDRLHSQQILTKLVDTPIAIENQNDEICLRSHVPLSACFERPHKGERYIPFSLSEMQNFYGLYNCSCADGFFWFGLVNPCFLSAMVDVQEFLENMDKKYHYLSDDGHNAAGMENAGTITD